MVVVLNHIDTVPEDRRQAMLDDVRRLLDDDGLGGVAGARGQRPRRRSASTSCAPRSRAGSRPRSSPGSGSRPTCAPPPARSTRPAATASPASCRASGSPSSRTRSPTPPGCRSSSTPSSAPPACGPAARPGGRSCRGCRGSGPTRSRGSTSTSATEGAALTGSRRRRLPETTPVQRARVDTEVRALADDVSAGLARAVGRGRTPRLGVALGRARRPARRCAGRHRPRRREAARLGRAGARAAVAADPRRRSAARSGPLCSRRVGRCPTTRRTRSPGCRCPLLLLVGGVVLGILLALVCRVLVGGDGPVPGRGGRRAAARRRPRGGARAGRRARSGRAGGLRRRCARASQPPSGNHEFVHRRPVRRSFSTGSPVTAARLSVPPPWLVGVQIAGHRRQGDRHVQRDDR